MKKDCAACGDGEAFARDGRCSDCMDESEFIEELRWRDYKRMSSQLDDRCYIDDTDEDISF